MEIPLFLPLLAFCVGLFAGDLYPVVEWPIVAAAAVATITVVSLRRGLLRAAQVGVLALFSVAGYVAAPPLEALPEARLSVLEGAEPGIYEGTVEANLPGTGGRSQIELELSARCFPEGCVPATGRVRLGWSGETPAVGRHVRFRARLGRIEPSGNPDERDPIDDARRDGIIRRGTVVSGGWVAMYRPGVDAMPSALERAWTRIDDAREWVKAGLRRFYRQEGTPGTVGLLLGLSLGERTDIQASVRDDFARAGLAHLLAISGSHFMLVAVGIEAILRALALLLPGRGRRWPAQSIAAVGAMAPVALYAFLVGVTPAIGRALLMAMLVLGLRAVSRRVSPLALLVLAGLTIVVLTPSALWDVGCQLSFASVLALITLAPRLQDRWDMLIERLPGEHASSMATVQAGLRRLGTLVTTSAAATLATGPICAYYFQNVPLAGVLANVAAVPLLGAISVPLVLSAGTLGLLDLPGAGLLLEGACRVISIGVEVAKLFGDPDLFPPWRIKLSAAQAALAAVAVGTLLLRGRRRLLALVAMTTLLVAWRSLETSPSPGLTMTQLNVGQGDSTVLTLPDGRVVVVDGGGAPGGRGFDPGRNTLYPYLLARGHPRVDLMVLSHPHPDHLGGLATLAALVPVDDLWIGELPSRDGEFRDFVDDVEARGTRVQVIDATSPLPELAGVRFRCLHPIPGWRERMPSKRARSVNNGSVVLEVSYGDVDILLAGDIERDVEALLAEEGVLRQVEVVKVPHHGSDTSSTDPLVDATQPAVAVFGVGRDNHFGFPRWSVVRRWTRAGTQLYRTDRDGAVELRIDGSSIEVQRYGRLADQVDRFTAY